MWSRVVEVMLGCWLLMSPFLLEHETSEIAYWITDFTCGGAVILFGLLSYWRPTRHAHLLSLIAGGWLIGFAYFKGFGSAPPAAQNHLILGLLLIMFAVIPNHAGRAASEWDEECPDLVS